MKPYLMLADGMSPHSLKWARELSKHFELSVVSFSGFREELYSFLPNRNLYALGRSVSPTGGNLSLLSVIPEVNKIVTAIRPAFVHAHYVTSYGLVAAIVKRINRVPFTLIMSAWGSDVLVTPHRNRFYYSITKFALNQSDVITSDSYFMADCIREMVARQVLVFPFGIESMPEVCKDDKDDDLIFSNRLLKSNYNVDKIIRLIYKLKDKFPKINLVIANEGYEKRGLEALVSTLGITDRVTFVGLLSSEEQARYYKTARYYISIPTSDSTSVSLLEAMSFGCIPIVSNIPANREWVINNYNGVFFYDKIELEDMSRLGGQIVDINRIIVAQNGFWPKNIAQFVRAVSEAA